MKKRLTDEEHPASERYLITYADLITLLLGLFVILYASSQVDSSKYQEMSQAMQSYFEKKGGDGILPGGKGLLPEKITDTSSVSKTNEEIAQQVQSVLQGFPSAGAVEVIHNPSEVIIKLPERLLFKAGKSDIEPAGRILLDSVAAILKGTRQEISIDGHTDSIPMRTFQFESNWHLSVDRAIKVGYHMLQGGLPKANTVIRGFGSERPAASNSTLDGRAKNRRVEITISMPVAAETIPADPKKEEKERFFQN